jgi:hypothetical protein
VSTDGSICAISTDTTLYAIPQCGQLNTVCGDFDISDHYQCGAATLGQAKQVMDQDVLQRLSIHARKLLKQAHTND